MLELQLEAPPADAATVDAKAGATLAAEVGTERNHRGRAAREPLNEAAEVQKEPHWMVVEPLEMRHYVVAGLRLDPPRWMVVEPLEMRCYVVAELRLERQ